MIKFTFNFNFKIRAFLLVTSIFFFMASTPVVASLSKKGHTLSKPKRKRGNDGRPLTFVHLFEWSWKDIAIECEEFLSIKGYDGVQISPPMDHILGEEWWTRYQPVTYGLNSRSGSQEELEEMISRCQKVGVEVYADAVINHMAAGSGDSNSIMGNSWGNRDFPGLYSAADFHHDDNSDQSNCQVNNYQDAHNVQYCDLTGLPDLVTGSDYVRQTIQGYLDSLLALGVKGLRIDAAKHQNVDELSQVIGGYAQDHFTFLEVISGAGEAVTPEMYLNLASVTEFNYGRSMYSTLINPGQLNNLESFTSSFIPSDRSVIFIDNHDTQRQDGILTYKNNDLYYFATMFMLAYPYGTPKVMSSYSFSNNDQGPPSSSVHNSYTHSKFNDKSNTNSTKLDNIVTDNENINCNQGEWNCEHRHVGVSGMVKFRQVTNGQDLENWTVLNSNCVAFSRGDHGAVAFNRDEGNSCQGNVKTSLPDGKYCNILAQDDYSFAASASCSDENIINVNNGEMEFNLNSLSAVAIIA